MPSALFLGRVPSPLMNRPRKNRWSSRSPQGPTVTLDEAAARRDLEAGRFREAIAGYKALIKQGDAPDAALGLAEAYAGRAGELAGKGMLKEALVIWENRRQLGAVAPPSADHAALLLRLDRAAAAAALYREAGQAGDRSICGALAERLAAHFLAGDAGIATALAADDPILVHGVAARAALAAYCAGDDEGLGASLAAIPYRSPYRDWVQILKALQRLPDRPQEAASLLARVAEDSAFAGLCRAVTLALAPEPELLAQLPEAGEASGRFALGLRGWGEERQMLWREATRLSPTPSPQALLRLLHRHQPRLGETWVRARALRLLVGAHPRSLQWLQEAGCRRASPLEQDLVAAWQMEEGRDAWATQRAWKRVAAHLADPPPPPGSDDALRLALVLRRLEQTQEILRRAGAAGTADPLSEVTAAMLVDSLVYDPDDPEPYLRLIAYHRGTGVLTGARRFLEPALARWPKDIGILTAALDMALTANAFKKAAGFARRILALDPINTGARERLVAAHLAHARKQLRIARFDLARRELAEAAVWARGERLGERIEVTGAFLTLGEDPPAGLAALRVLVERLGGGIAAILALVIEGAAVGRPPPALLKQAGLAVPRCQGREDLLAFFSRLRAHLDGGGRPPRELATLFEKPLKAAATLPAVLQEVEVACEILRRCVLQGVRRVFAETALKRWPGVPILVLHAFEARHAGSYYLRVGDRELDRLEAALARARAEGDMRTAHRLTELLDEIAGPSFEPGDSTGAPLDLPAGFLSSVIEALGLDGFLTLAGFDAETRRILKQAERDLGLRGVIELLQAMLRDKLPGGLDLPNLPFGPPRVKPSQSPLPRGRKPASAPEDDDTPDQLDLFP